MHFKKFSIHRYRAIDHAEVPVGNNLIPVIGINESGKTSILQAILAFDRLKDNYNAGNHLDYKNKYVLGDHPCTITAEVVLDADRDIRAVRRRLQLGSDNELIRRVERMLADSEPIHVMRNLNTRKYSVSGFGLDETRNERFATAIYRSLPVILYFDDFSDRVPEAIHFIKARSRRKYKHYRSKTAEWQRIIEEVFKRATEGKHTLADFVDMTDTSDQKGLLSDIQDTLDDAIMKEWKELKKWGGTLADDPGDLELSLDYRPLGDRTYKFEFKVQDRSRTRARFFNITERSKGFQWFFNFSMKLKFNPKYKEDQKGAIYLLDEPGSYLHSSAQEELLKALEKISELNAVIYCTHSQHLLDPEVINVSVIKIAAKEEGEVKVVPFGSAGTANYQGALTPLYQALRLRTGAFNEKIKAAVITEGITDYYLFRLLSKYRKEFRHKDLTFIPGAGADQLRDLISFAIAWADRYLVLFDSDKAGRKAAKKYDEFFGAKESANFYHYAIPGVTDDVRLEDFLSTPDQERLLTMTGVETTKAAFAVIYYAAPGLQKAFIAGLDDQTLANLSLVRDRLSNHQGRGAANAG